MLESKNGVTGAKANMQKENLKKYILKNFV